MTLKLGIVGFGKIARDEHVPAIARTSGAELVAIASRNARAEGIPGYSSLTEMMSAQPDLDAVVLCQPPVPRFEAAREAILAGKHVFLEKPPGATVSEVEVLRDLANAHGVTLFASWHSRWSGPVRALKAWCDARTLRHVDIAWKEDVRIWHPGQDWIWEAGGFGVMDPGINALSILTEVVDSRIRLIDATLQIPQNKAAPIAATMTLQTADGVPVDVAFDWRQTGPQIWCITLEDMQGERFVFGQTGEDAAHAAPDEDSTLAAEYRAMYSHFVDLVAARQSDVDTAPLQIVGDAFLRGRFEQVEPFED